MKNKAKHHFVIILDLYFILKGQMDGGWMCDSVPGACAQLLLWTKQLVCDVCLKISASEDGRGRAAHCGPEVK